MIHLECLSCEGHPLCMPNMEKMIQLDMTREVSQTTCPLCKKMVGLMG